MVLVCLPLATPIGLSPLHSPTLCGSERVLVVSTEPPDDLSRLTTPGVGRPRHGLLPAPLTRCIQVHTGGGGGGRNRAPGPHKNTARQAMDGLWTEVCGQQKQSNDPGNNPAHPQYANNWAPLTRKRHTMPHSVQPQHTNDGAPRTRKRHQQEHRPQRPTERSDPTQHAKGRTGDCPGPRKGATTRRNVTRGGGGTNASAPPQRVPHGRTRALPVSSAPRSPASRPPPRRSPARRSTGPRPPARPPPAGPGCASRPTPPPSRPSRPCPGP